MLRKTVNHRRIQILVASLIVLETFAAGVWHVVKSRAPLAGNVEASIFETSRDLAPAVIPETVTPEASFGRIKIPSIALDAAIDSVGLTPGSDMAVPSDPLHAGWYDLGPRPGEIGSAVIDGHVNWYYGATGVFADLHKLQAGDTITVEDATGVSSSFVVREIRRYDPSADASEVFFSTDGKAHLNLITCDGVWDKNAQQYSVRLVVFADKI
jgi:LPXTG-site transpeptidase (sortase) family protein